VKTPILCALLLVAACHKQRPPAPTPEQSNRLNETDSMLNDLANEEGPEANASGPSR
jgi:nitrous oxide reductase accessory protein NosL